MARWTTTKCGTDNANSQLRHDGERRCALDNHRSGPHFAGTRTGMRDGGGTGYAWRLRRVLFQFARPHNADTLFPHSVIRQCLFD